MPFVPGQEGQLFNEGGRRDQGVGLVQGGVVPAKVGVSCGNGIGNGDEPAARQLRTDGFPLGLAESWLGEEFLLGDD